MPPTPPRVTIEGQVAATGRKVCNCSQFRHPHGLYLLGNRACALPSRSLQHHTTHGKLKIDRCGTTANLILLRDFLFCGTARVPYPLVLVNWFNFRLVKGEALQPILLSSGTLFFGAVRMRHTYYFIANWSQKHVLFGNAKIQIGDNTTHTGTQKEGVPEEGENRRTSTIRNFLHAFQALPWPTIRATWFWLPDRCALTGRISRG